MINFDGKPVSSNVLSVMGRDMIHRGPDDEGIWTKGSIGIGMRRLSIIDLKGGQQPITNEVGDVLIVLNGEIYNYKELREELISKGHIFSTRSDVEVIPHLYEEMGVECIHRLNGMFAFALYDQRQGRLWLARDRLGIKPLYYHRFDDGLAFSSEVCSLASATSMSIDPDKFVTYLGYSYIPEPLSIYKNIRKLEAGSQILIENRKVQHSRYWRINCLETWQDSETEACNKLEELLLDAAKLQLRSDVPVGIFLSGGVDSSGVAALAAKFNGDDLVKTLTIDFKSKGGEDAAYADLVAKHIHSNHECIEISADVQMEALEELMPRLDEPMSDSAIVPTYILSREARKRGIKVLLSGAGGDEIFGGYSRHHVSKIGSAAWIAHYSIVRSLFCRTMWHRPHWVQRFATSARNFAVMISGVNLEFLRSALRCRDDYDRLLEQFENDFSEASDRAEIKRMKIDLENYLPNNVLALTDKATMAASVEGRVPLLDHRVVEFAFSLPANINILNGRDKGLFKKMLDGYLPNAVLYRGKEGFNAPMNDWMVNDTRITMGLKGKVHPMIEDLIDIKVVKRWLDAPSLRKTAGDSLYSLYLLNKYLIFKV